MVLTKKPYLERLGGPFSMWCDSDIDGVIGSFCPEKFERMTGVKLKPGECRRMRLTLKLEAY